MSRLTTPDMTERLAELEGHRAPFVHATVVRAQAPSAAQPGDQAVIHSDGNIEGFVGGHCAAAAVRDTALEALENDRSVLLRILPDTTADFPTTPGAVVVVNQCLSGGALEIFLEPKLPPDVIHIAGQTPIADSVAFFAEHLGFAVLRDDSEPVGALAAIVSIQGGDEPRAVEKAITAGIPYIGLVASQKRGHGMIESMGLSPPEKQCVHTPAGLPIGGRTPQEIALSILAEIIQENRSGKLKASPTRTTVHVPPASTAIDPVCGMTVAISPETPHLALDGQDYWFCCVACRNRYAEEH